MPLVLGLHHMAWSVTSDWTRPLYSLFEVWVGGLILDHRPIGGEEEMGLGEKS